MKSLRMRSGSGGTVELLQMGELEDGAVVVVAHLGDAPAREALGLPAAGLILERLADLGAALRLVAGEGGVVRACFAVGLVAVVEAAGGTALVAQFLAAVVEARVVDRAVDRRAELADLPLAEAPAHRDDAQVGLGRGAAGLVGREPGPAGVAECAADLRDAVEVVLGQALP